MFRSLAFVAMRQQQHDAGWQIPFIFRRADELIDDHLRAVGKIAELRLPQHQRFRIIPAITVFKAQDAGFRKRGIVNFAARLT